jgi:hypothetical protein
MAGLMTACGGSSKSSSDDDNGADDDTAPVDDDTTPVDDDTTPVDDDTTPVDDDTVDDDTAPDDDTVMPPPDWYCDLPAITGLDAGQTVGGGSISGTITVYVFNDSDCTPLEGATVLSGGNTYTTDASGMATVTADRANVLVTAFKDGYWSWAYQVDAAIMAFRLRPNDYGLTYADSTPGDFLTGGSPLGLQNPTGGLTQLLSSPIYIGAAIPGVSRYTLLSQDFNGLFSTATFDINYSYNFGTPTSDTLAAPRSIYFPAVDLNVSILTYGVTATSDGNTQIMVPMLAGLSQYPIEGLTAEVNIGGAGFNVISLGQIIIDAIGGNYGAVADLVVKPLINNGFNFNYVGANPTWDGTGAANIDMLTPAAAKGTTVTFSGASGDYDYLAVLAAEIPNRALLPLGMKIKDTGNSVTVQSVDVPDARYDLVAGKTDLLTSGLTSLNLGFVFKFANDLSEWSSGVAIADSDFLPLFDSLNTAWDSGTATVTWAFQSAADVSVVLAIYVPTTGPWSLAVINGAETSYTPPVADLGVTPSDSDIVVLVGIQLPAGVDPNAFDPTHLLNYDSLAMNLWTNFDLSTILPTF